MIARSRTTLPGGVHARGLPRRQPLVSACDTHRLGQHHPARMPACPTTATAEVSTWTREYRPVLFTLKALLSLSEYELSTSPILLGQEHFPCLRHGPPSPQR